MTGWQWVITACGGIATIGGAVAMVKKLLEPLTNLSKRVGEVEAHDKRDMERFVEIETRLMQSDKADQALYKAVLAMLNHSIDGNSIDKMKKARDALNEHIIEK